MRSLVLWIVVAAIILMIWLAVGIGESVGNGLTEWQVVLTGG